MYEKIESPIAHDTLRPMPGLISCTGYLQHADIHTCIISGGLLTESRKELETEKPRQELSYPFIFCFFFRSSLIRKLLKRYNIDIDIEVCMIEQNSGYL